VCMPPPTFFGDRQKSNNSQVDETNDHETAIRLEPGTVIPVSKLLRFD
jgi:hypothetical protein